jgi:lysophospholipase L1-like esterase/Tfp pilus assembly protein PilF
MQTRPSVPRRPAKRIWLFRGIALLLPILLLLLLEGSLRLFHYGYDTSLFIESPADRNFLTLNPDASQKYFTDRQNATKGNLELFKKEKDAHTLRIFVLGESTTIGYPYFHNGSFHRWLQYRLMKEFPEKNFEIVNLALTAVNSYTVLGFGKELVRYEPDAVLIYTGHNEYYGALGVGSTNRIGGSPYLVNILLTLRQLRTVQLMTNGYEKIARALRPAASREGKTRMELMVADQEIPYESKLFYRGIDQFRSNMEELLQLFNRRHIPVFISNVVSNEKDVKPFVTIAADSLRYQGNALSDYRLGRLAYGQGDFKKAKDYFSWAKALDALRFRAPDQINDIITELSRKYPNAHLVDTKAAFEAGSENRIIGNELLLEHVHPNLAGYALMSEVFYQAIKREHLLPPAEGKEMSFPQLQRDMPITEVDSLAAVYRIAHLKRNWPFSDSPGTPGGLASFRDSLKITSEEGRLAYSLSFEHLPWEEAMSRLYDHYIEARDLVRARKVVETLVLEHPTDPAFYEKTAMLCGELREEDDAIFYFGKAFGLAPSFEKAHYLFVLCLQQDRPADAMPYLDYAMNNNTAGLNLAPVKTAANEIIQLQRASANDSTNLVLLNRIAHTYFRMGNREGAQKYVEKVLLAAPANADALSLLSLIRTK